MREDQFDRCPECGAFPKFGLRCHPKFSIILPIEHDEGGQVMLYAHSPSEIRALWELLGSSGDAAFQQWNGDAWEVVYP